MSDDPLSALADVALPETGSESDSVTEVTSQSWFGRLAWAVVGAVFGLALLPLGVVVLIVNEGEAVQKARALTEGTRLAIDIPAAPIDPAREGQLVHVSGPLQLGGPATDPEFGLSVPDAVQLRRQVEMYQWHEERKSETHRQFGGGRETVTTTSYEKVWYSYPIDSSRFSHPAGHGNPPMRYREQVTVPGQVRLGDFRLDEAALRRIGTFEPLPAGAVPPRAGAQPFEGGLYLGADPQAPRIGDLRITWQVARATAASVLGRQTGDRLTAYQTQAGEELLLVATGAVPAAAMIRTQAREDHELAWALRGVGAAMLFMGVLLLLWPVVLLAGAVPLFETIAGFGAALVALLVTVVVAPVVIALAWLAYRPLVALAVLAGGLAMAVPVGRWMRRWKRERRVAAWQRRRRPPGLLPARLAVSGGAPGGSTGP